MEPIHDSSYEAILHPAQQLLILATAGSGKTFALTHRVRAAVLDGVRPDRVLALTFTRKAAAELKERLKGLIGPAAAKKIVAGTFHAIALRILKKYGEKFTVCNEEEARGILRRMLEERGQPAEWAAGLQEEIGRRKLIAAVPAMDAGTRLDPEIPPELVDRIVERYQADLCRAAKKDYDDLLVQTLERLRAEPERAEALGFRAIYVDEVQDANRIQMEIVQRLATPVTCVTCVGDLDQTIFSFQRADPEVVLSLHTYFPAIETLYLSQNRRCSGNITHASAALIRNNTRRRDHPISTPNPDGALIRLVTASDRRQEVESVVREIQSRRREGVPYREMAVLYRNNYQSETIENRLVVEQLPYTIGGGRFSYFQRPAIKAAVCGLRLLHDATDEPARKYLLQTPLWASRPERGQELDQALDSLRRETGGPLTRLLPQTLSRLRLWTPVPGVLAAAAVPPEPYRSLLEVARSFETLEAFLGYSQEVPAREGQDAVNLLTIHCAKGKEFDTVFLIGLEDGILPDHRARTLAEVEEERRVKFVAMTRAKQQLVLSHAQYRERSLGDREWRRRSRFLDEIPGDYLEHRVLEDLYDGGLELVERL